MMSNTTFTSVAVAVAAILVVVGATGSSFPKQNSTNYAAEKLTALPAYTTIQAEGYSEAYGVYSYYSCYDYASGYIGCVQSIGNGDYIGFDNVRFSNPGAQGVSVRFASQLPENSRGSIQWILDSPDNLPFHITTLGYTRNYQTFITINEYINYAPAARDTHTLYLKFATASGNADFLYLDWIQFFQ